MHPYQLAVHKVNKGTFLKLNLYLIKLNSMTSITHRRNKYSVEITLQIPSNFMKYKYSRFTGIIRATETYFLTRYS